MNNTDTKTPSSFLALTVGIFIGAMLVLPMFAYMCRVNWQLRQENQRLRVQVMQTETRLSKLQQIAISHFGPVRDAVSEEEWSNALHHSAAKR